MFRFLTSFSLIVTLAHSSQAQDSLRFSADTADVVPFESEQIDTSTTTPIRKRLFSPGLLVDYGKLMTMPLDFETKWEIGVDLLIAEKWQLVAEYGQSEVSPDQAYKNGDYRASGNHYRIGFGYIPLQTPPNGRLGLGVRYGASTFDEAATLTISSDIQPSFVRVLDRSALQANWWELVIYSDQKLNEWMSIGFHLRMRFLLEVDQPENDLEVYAIPGYGKSLDSSIPALNLVMRFSLP